jgi:biotin carboxylase
MQKNSNLKKILILGGSTVQISIIKKAKELGFYVITCDYLPNNPGHFYADKYYNVSTVDYEEVLKIAQVEKIDAISSYASDPGAYTAAYVAQIMGLKGTGIKAVEVLSNKNNFRKFLNENNFNHPDFISGSKLEDFEHFKSYPAVLKPVDSSGSKGVVKVKNESELKSSLEFSISYSRTKTVILEEFIERCGPQIHGEVFVIDNKIEVFELGDQYFSPISSFVPYSTVLPTYYHNECMTVVKQDLQRLLEMLEFQNGGLNVEAIKDSSGKVYLIEVGARSGGNFMPELVFYSCGVDLVELNITTLLDPNRKKVKVKHRVSAAQIIFHSFRDGKFSGIRLPDNLNELEFFRSIITPENIMVRRYANSSDVVGVGIYGIDKIKRDEFERLLMNYDFIKT